MQKTSPLFPYLFIYILKELENSFSLIKKKKTKKTPLFNIADCFCITGFLC